ncbi:MlaD family protein [Nocardia inohanensis]|uniref:MlaD family protein n=1 Tax=Nocardia inohanensis TaxID=209246 RepID=UPI000A068E17|nr:MlaD family protein [Nocardia inohanensis]
MSSGDKTLTRRVRPASIASLTAMLAVLLLGASYLTFGLLRFDPFAEHITARLLLANSGTVRDGTPVLLTGIEVGRVTEVHKVADGVEVRFRIDEDFRVPATSAVRIENLSALGEPYIEFRPASDAGPYLSDNQLLDARTVAAPMLIPDLSAKVVQVVGQFDPKAIANLVATLDRAFAGTEGQLPRVERASTLLAATVLSRTSLIRQLLTDLQTAGADMAWTGPALADSGPYWSLFATRVDSLVTTASRLFEVGDSPDDYLRGDGLVPFLKQLDEFLAKNGPGFAQLAPMLRPMITQTTDAIAPLDISALISTALATVGDDGTVHLQVGVK